VSAPVPRVRPEIAPEAPTGAGPRYARDDSEFHRAIGFIRLRHHRMVASFRAIDYPVIVLNLVLVAAIVLLPFGTQAVGDPGINDLALPTALMAVTVAAASILHAGAVCSPAAAG
jgi:hypothetical protein